MKSTYYTERPVATTAGHSATHGGLRGHSIDHTVYPWRVVGVGKHWEVHGTDPNQIGAMSYDSDTIHDAAINLKTLHPAGRVESTSQGPANISGDPAHIAERLYGQVLVLSSATTQRHNSRFLVIGGDSEVVKTVSPDNGEYRTFFSLWLAHNQHIGVTLGTPTA